MAHYQHNSSSDPSDLVALAPPPRSLLVSLRGRAPHFPTAPRSSPSVPPPIVTPSDRLAMSRERQQLTLPGSLCLHPPSTPGSSAVAKKPPWDLHIFFGRWWGGQGITNDPGSAFFTKGLGLSLRLLCRPGSAKQFVLHPLWLRDKRLPPWKHADAP